MRNKAIQVLLLEDSPLDALLTIEVLRGGSGFEVTHKCTLAEVESVLSSHLFDVALIDLGLPDSEGLSTVVTIMKWAPSLPIIVLTSNADDQAAHAAIQLGAQDYLVKGTIVPDLFYRSIRYSIERKKSERALKESEAFLRRSQEIAHIGSWRFNVETREMTFSDEIFSILGMPVRIGPVPYADFREHIYPDDLKEVDRFYLNGCGLNEDDSFVHRLLTGQGQIRVVRQKCERADRAGRGAESWFGTLHDITEEKNKEHERLRLVTAMEQAAESVVITDTEGYIQYVNPFFEKTSGYSSAEAVGRKTSILKSGKQDQAFYEQMWKTLLAGKIWSGRLVNKRKDGSLYTEDCNISSVRNGGGEIINFVAVKSDVTEALILEEKYYNAQKMEAIGTLAGGIAHDFNNILTAILGYTTLAQKAMDDEAPGQEDLAQVLIAAHRAKDLVRQILDFSRRSEEDLQPVQFNIVVKEVLKLLRASIPENVEIQQRIINGNTMVLCSPTRLHQVVMNLCTNAYQAMPWGGRLVVGLEYVVVTPDMRSCYPDLTLDEYLKLTVGDTGEGIDNEALKKVFDPYFSTKKEGHGTGLGLSVVQGIVSQLGGAVYVESELTKGTVFSVFLPRINGTLDTRASMAMADTAELEATGNILFVDNEDSLAVLGKKMLESLGYTVTCCSSSIEALAFFRRGPLLYDLLITDYSMPQIMGTRLIDEVRKIRPGTPAILVSGLVDRIADEYRQAGRIEAILEKPLDKEVLARTVQHVLGATFQGRMV